MSETEKLEPCPFCGEDVAITYPQAGDTREKWGAATCISCGAVGPDVRTDYDTSENAPWRAEAIKEWNRRALPSRSDVLEEAARVADKWSEWRAPNSVGQKIARAIRALKSKDTDNG
ncbi:MAG: Lar family restriction alleviation protein [Alphaproteobacteria bacterium]|nr:Lar family restriction alleviation protein [Alphaproteobacteria bacterium]